MKADILIQRLELETTQKNCIQITVKRDEARLLLERISQLEKATADLLRLFCDQNEGTVVPIKPE